MAIDGEVNYAVRADTSGFEGPLNKANGLVGGLGKAFAGIGAAIAAATAAVAGIGKAVSAAAEVESLGVSMEVLTGSMERGKQLMQDIRQLGAATPYDFGGLAEGAKVMLQYGVATEKIIPTLRMLGDIAGGDKNKLGALTNVFGQIASTGRLTGGDLLQLINAGFNPLLEISRKTGESVATLKERMEKGQISFEEVADAMRSATSAGGQFFGMMEKQSKTTMGLLSTLGDAINEVFVTLGQPVNDALKPLLTEAISIVERIGMGLEAAINLGRSAIEKGRFGDLMAMSMKIAGAELLNGIAHAVQFAGNAIYRVVGMSFRQVTRMFDGSLTDIATKFAEGLGSVLKGTFLVVAGNLKSQLIKVAQSVAEFFDGGLGAAMQRLGAKLLAGFEWAVDGLKALLAKIPGVAEALGLEDFSASSLEDLTKKALAAVGEGAKWLVNTSGEEMVAEGERLWTEGLGKLGESLKDRADVYSGDLQDAIDGIMNFVPKDLINVDALRNNLSQLLQSVDPANYRQFLAALTGAGAPIAAAAEQAAQAIAKPAKEAAKEDEKGRKRIKLYGLEESEQRRQARMSDADKAKAAAGGVMSLMANAPSRLLDRAAEAAGQSQTATAAAAGAVAAASQTAPAMTPPPRRGAPAADPRRSTEATLIEVLREIAANTAPMRQIAAA